MTSPRVRVEEASQAILLDDDAVSGRPGDLVTILGQPDVVVIDRLGEQQAELSRLVPAVGREIVDEAPRWSYYPWRRTVARILGPRGFRRLRLDRNRNKITTDEQQKLDTVAVAVVGLSVGHAIGFALAQEGLCGHLILADYDDLELSNLNRVPSSLLDVGLQKTTVLARRIAELDPYLTVTTVAAGATDSTIEEIVGAADLVIDECDSIDIKFKLRFCARRLGIPVIMHTSDGGILDVERYDIDQSRPVFHGMVDIVDPTQLEGLSNADKIPLIMAILDVGNVSARMAASLLELDQQVTTWPQLASDVTLGAAMVGATVRRLALGQPVPSGRLRVDLDHDVALLQPPTPVDIGRVHNPVESPLAGSLPAASTLVESSLVGSLPAASTLVESSLVESPLPGSPAGGSLPYRLMDSARRAPSGGNSQPWRFAASDASFSVYLDPDRSTGIDIAHRGSLVGAGAALFNAEVSAAAQGRLGAISTAGASLTLGQRLGTQPLATLKLSDQIDLSLADLEPQIVNRATCRASGPSEPIDREWLEQSTSQALADGAQLISLRGHAKGAAGDIWAEADRVRFLDESMHREMMSELRWPGDELTTGIDVRTLGLNASELTILDLARRPQVMRELASWSGGTRLGDGSKKLINDADALLILTAPGPGDGDFMAGGRTLQRIWLHAAAAGVGLQPMSPLFLYALNPTDLERIVDSAKAARLWDLRTRLTRLCGLQPQQPISLCVRATSLLPDAVRSLREPVDARHCTFLGGDSSGGQTFA